MNKNKYWTRLEEYDRSVVPEDYRDDFLGWMLFKDLEHLENFTYSERKWLHDNVKKYFFINYYIDEDGMINDSGDSSVDFETPSIGVRVNAAKIRIKTAARLQSRDGWISWIVFKHKDDWFYWSRRDGNELYKCDGFLGLKKLLEHLDLLK